VTFSDRNLCDTVERRARYETQKCAVKHRKAFPPAFALDPSDPDYMREDAIFTWDHQWSDHAGGTKGGRCAKCHRTLKEVRVRIKPEPRRAGRIAAEIARTPRDVPPVRFTGGAWC
jgi:hypothetical protein